MVATALATTATRASSPTTAPTLFLESGSARGRRSVSTLRHSPSSRGFQATRGPLLSENVVLLIQEWLTIAQLPATQQCFLDEYTRTQKQPPPSLDQWFEMTKNIDLSALTATRSFDSCEHAHPALLERIVDHVFAQDRKLPKPPTTVVVSKRPATAAPALKFANKRSLPTGSSSFSTQSKSMSALPSPAARPKSAITVAVSKSSSDLAPTNLQHGIHSSNNREERNSTPSKKASSTSSSPLTVRPGSGRVESPKKSPGPQRSSISGSTRLSLTPSTKLLPVSARSDTERRKQTTQEAPEATDMTAKDARPEMDELEPSVDLEDMTEEHLAEHYTGFSKSDIKRLRRVLTKSSVHSQELQRTRTVIDKIQLRAQQRHERSAFAAKQTELLSTTMDMLIKEPCSLCRYVFLRKNLTTKVSYKSICDLRAFWAAQRKRERREEIARAAAAATAVAGGAPLSSIHDPIDTDPDEGEVAVALESTQQIAHLYDEVPVCVFCAQLALNFSSYRPTSAEQRRRKEAEHQQAVERQKQRELQRHRERLKCDPLDFHSYELNSDDEDESFETDEVLEVDANGRVQVVRRPRNRRRTVRTPAQTGLVSKRIHYDHLRSQSVHALNRQEWEMISQAQHGA